MTRQQNRNLQKVEQNYGISDDIISSFLTLFKCLSMLLNVKLMNSLCMCEMKNIFPMLKAHSFHVSTCLFVNKNDKYRKEKISLFPKAFQLFPTKIICQSMRTRPLTKIKLRCFPNSGCCFKWLPGTIINMGDGQRGGNEQITKTRKEYGIRA